MRYIHLNESDSERELEEARRRRLKEEQQVEDTAVRMGLILGISKKDEAFLPTDLNNLTLS